MKNFSQLCLAALAWLALTGAAHAQGTAFTYQGRLNSGTTNLTGLYDFTFALFNVSSGAGQVGSTLNSTATPVTNGLFTATLDFGAQFPGAGRWLEITVRTNGGGAFTTLTPRQRITATPYAITASNITGLVPASSLAGTYSSAVTLNNAGNSFTGNGAGLASLNANNLASGTVPDARLAPNIARTNQVWQTAGNLGTTAGTDFLGTRDNQALELKVNSTRALRLEPNASGAPNVIGGSPNNFVGAGVIGGTVAGGGATNFVGLPYTNRVTATFGTVGGGANNASSGSTATVGGGSFNTGSGYGATVGGGQANTSSGQYATTGGGDRNLSGGLHSTVGGGASNTNLDDAATIGGGAFNGSTAESTTIGGGRYNFTSANLATVGGGSYNTNHGESATVAGGLQNVASGFASAVGGGEANRATNDTATVGGGFSNTSGGDSATISGGRLNLSTGASSVVGGGSGNTSTGTVATVGGGSGNISGGTASTVPGGVDNHAVADLSFAAGRKARAMHIGSFVWADSTDANYLSTANNQFLIRAGGGVGIGATNLTGALFIRHPEGLPAAGMAAADNGLALGQFRTNSYKWIQSYGGSLILNPIANFVGINKTNPASALDVNGTVTALAFNPPSDRNLKENFTPVSPREVLEKVSVLKITRWNFKGDDATPHVGPMAQDFHAAFGLGTDERHIATVDADGVALAAIQGLHQKLEEGRQNDGGRMMKLEKENAALKARLEKLEQLLSEKNGGAR